MRIAIFGTGSGMVDILSVLPNEIEIVGLCDNDAAKHGKTVSGHTVHAPSAILELDFDFIVVTARAGELMRRQLVSLGIEREKILLFYSSFDCGLRKQINRDMDALNASLGLRLHPLSLCTMPLWPQIGEEPPSSQDDFCRVMSLRLAAERIHAQNVAGSIAEVGVYRGEFAAILNRLFPDRTLYLFDTFEGFSNDDLSDEKKGNHSTAAIGDFEDTNVDLVLARMAKPDKVVVRKGYFPETAAGLDENFAFVSLDVDLYKPMAAGLRYFYPRLSKGGCMFIHDYNSLRYKGVKTAVEEFVRETGAPVVPLPDFAGTAVLPK
jgi:O-methyltransferase